MESKRTITKTCFQKISQAFLATIVFMFAAFLLQPSSLALAAPPQVVCVPQLSSDLLVPHETWSGEATILKGIAREITTGTYYWEFGDGESSTPTAFTTPDNLAATHTYDATPGTLLIARLHVLNAANEESTDEYRILVKEENQEAEINKAIDDGLWWLYTHKESTATYNLIPASAFTTPNNETGLLGQYFNNTNLTGNPALERIDNNIDFIWSGSPGPGVNNDFSCRWTGTLHIPESGIYSFASYNDDGTRIYIDGNLVLDDWHGHGPSWRYSNTLSLTAGEHSFQVDFYDSGAGAQAKIYWSATNQYRWNNVSRGNHYGNTTASAVQAFEINGHLETGDPDEDPYVNAVKGGLCYLLTTLASSNIGEQHGDNPDSNNNGIGLNWPSNYPIYELGAVMDAMVATGTPDTIATQGGVNVIGRRYQDIVQDMVDMYAWGQGDWSNGGGWRYSWNQWPDNSASQWGAIGMIAAEKHFGCTVPTWVKERNDAWLTQSYNGTGFGYTGAGNSWATTPSGMVQLAFAGKDVNDPRWQTAENWLANNWTTFLAQWSGNHSYGYYALAKAMRLALPQEVSHFSSTSFDWYGDETNGLARHLINHQHPGGYWHSQSWLGEQTATAWNVIILTRTLFEKPPVGIVHAQPNPGAIGQTITFDASDSYHIDPAKEIVQYLWDFDADDGVDFLHPDATGTTATHAYGTLDDYTVTLKVIDNSTPERFDITGYTVRITIPPHPPTAVIGGPYIAAEGEAVQVDGSGSYDIDQSAGDSIISWDWESDMVTPYQYNEATGETALLPAFTEAGRHDIILRVTDNTETIFPSSGKPNLVNTDFGAVNVYKLGVTGLAARPKGTKCQLTWPHIGAANYEIIRSEKAPNSGFELIGSTSSTYSTFIDYNVVLRKDYWYRVRCEIDGATTLSAPVHVNSRGRIRNYPPVISSTPVTDAEEASLYEYQVEANDPEGTQLTYLLDQAPAGMTIDLHSGLINWTPVFAQAGVNDVMIRVTDTRRASATQFFQIVVTPRPNTAPEINHGGPYSGLITNAISFSGSAVDPEGDPLVLYRWSFGDGTEAEGAEVTHTYMASGTYTVTLFVTDDRGATGYGETTCQIEFPNRPPIASIGGPYSGVVDTELGFDGNSSYDADSDPLTCTWNFGDSTPAVTGIEAHHTYTAPGAYNVALSVDDGRGGLDTSEIRVIITPPNQAPTAAFNVSGTVARNHTITFDGTSSSDPENRPLTAWEWDFGNGASTTGAIVTHVYSEAGDFTVNLTVTDTAGATGMAHRDIHVVILSVEVPDLSSMTETDARTAITDAVLVTGSITQLHSATVPTGQIISQDPAAGQIVEEESRVNFVVSTGPLMITVPDLAGMSTDNATAAIESALLLTGTITTLTSSEVAAGNVISQSPAPGIQLEEGQPVNLTISAGPAPVTVPDIQGMTRAAAESAIITAGLAVGTITEEHSLTVPQGNVLSQLPDPGTLAPPNTAVNLVTSSGPLMVAVPNVAGLEQSAAEQIILTAGLTLGTVTTLLSETIPQGNVISQSPTAGTVIQEQNPVDLVISAGPDAVIVPDITGMPQASAESTIIGAGLIVGNIDTARDNNVAQGAIISQNPLPGVALPPGNAVDFVVCEGPHIPTTVELQLDRNIVTAGNSITISMTVYDDTGSVVEPSPQVDTSITFNAAEVDGTIPEENGGVISTDTDTRGPYTLTVSLNEFPSVTGSVDFAVSAGGADAPMKTLYSNLSATINTITENTGVLAGALENNDIIALQDAIDAMRANRDSINLEDLSRSAAFAPEQGFPPTVADLQAKGVSPGADDAAFKAEIRQLITLMRQTTFYLNNQDPTSTVDDETVLSQLNTSMQSVVDQLHTLHPSIYGWTDARLDVNYLMAIAIPEHIHAVVNRLENELSAVSLITMTVDPEEFYNMLGTPNKTDRCPRTADLYTGIKPAFFSLIGMSMACNIQMSIIKSVYVPVLWDLARMAAIMAAQDLLNAFTNNAGMAGIITGASLSFHAFNMAGSVIEVNGPFNRDYPKRNQVYLVGPDAVQAIADLLNSFNPSDIENLDDLYDYFTGIRDAIAGAGAAYDAALQPPDDTYCGCILDWSDSCLELVYNGGFNSVYTCQSWLCPPAPVLFLAQSPDNGPWAFGVYSFVGN